MGTAWGFGGARRDRTDDLMLAKHALYQLSYRPEVGKFNGGEVHIAPRRHFSSGRCYSCAGSGSIVRAFTGTWTSSRYGDVIMTMRIRGKASMNAR